MSKQFNFNNPADKFISKRNTDDTDTTQGTDNKQVEDTETKSKRLNLLVKPSVYEDFRKIATMEQESVNGLLNLLMEEVVNENKEQIELFNKVFPND